MAALSSPLSEPWKSAVAALLRESGCTIRKWHKGYNGSAFTRDDDWGIEVPEPRGPISFAIFAHEVAHQMLHRSGSKPRWLEEIEAWEWALDCFDRLALPGKDKVIEFARRAVGYSLGKALRRSRRRTTRKAINLREREFYATYPRQEARG